MPSYTAGFQGAVSYSPIGDENTDNTDRFAAALAGLHPGGRLWIPANRTILLNGSSLTPPAGVYICGAGTTSVLKRTVSTSPMFTPGSNVAFGNLKFLGGGFNASAGNNGSAVYAGVSSASGVSIRNCLFEGFSYAVRVLKGNAGFFMENSHATKCASALFCSEGGDSHSLVNCTFNGVRDGVGDGVRGMVGIWFSDPGDGSDAGAHHSAVNCRISSTRNEGIIIRSAYTDVINCHVTDADDGSSGSYGIVVEGTSGITNIGEFGAGAGNHARIINCTVRNCNGGIRVSYDPVWPNSTPRDVTIDGCVIEDTTGAHQKGIAIGFSEAGRVVRPTVRNCKIRRVAGTGNSDGLYLRHIADGVIDNVEIHTTTRYGVLFDHKTTGSDLTTDTVLSNCKVWNPTGNGIFVWARAANQVKRLAIVNSHVFMQGKPGRCLRFEDTANGYDSCIIAGNIFHGSAANAHAMTLTGTNISQLNNIPVGTVDLAEYVGTYSLNGLLAA